MEILTLVQAVILFMTGAVVFRYTLETKRLREAANQQFQVMQRTHRLQLEEMQRAAEPIFVWGAGLGNGDRMQWEFSNEGGPISHVTITMQSPTGADTGIQANIRPDAWIGSSRAGVVTFDGNVHGEFRFTIGFRTRLGGVGGFFFLASRSAKPISTGSGWL